MQSIYLITGIMASGKSTVAQMLAETFPRAVHVRGDLFRRMIVSGREEMSPGASDEALRLLRLRHALAAHTADAFFDVGFSVVVQDVVIGKMLTEMLSLIQRRPLHVVVLCPSTEAVRQREANRSKKGYGEWSVEALDHVLRSETERLGLWLDTSDHTPEETTREILRRSREARVEC